MNMSERTNQQKIWTLTEDLAYNSDVVYVHSSVKNFQKAIKHSGLGEAIINEFAPYYESLFTALSQIEEQVNPQNLPVPEQGDRYDILKMFDKNGNSFAEEMDKFKQNIKNILTNPAYIKYQEYLKENKAETEVIVNEKISGGNSNKVIVKKLSVINNNSIGFRSVKSKQDFANLGRISGNTIVNLLGLKNDSQAGKMLPDLFEEIYSKYGTKGVTDLRNEANKRIVSNVTQKETGLREQQFLKMVSNLFIKLQKAIGKSSYETSYKFFNDLKNVNDMLENSNQLYTNLGNLYEDATQILFKNNAKLYNIYNGNISVKGTGTSSANKWNASDIELELKGVNAFKTNIGVSLKQQEDFNKGVNLTFDDLLNLDIGFHFTHKMINQYRYFMLNYSLLSSQEELGRQNKKDNSTLSLAELRDVKEILDDFLGRVIFMRALVGPILFNTKNTLEDRQFTKQTSSGKSMAPPYILVTQGYACFTYDLLKAAGLLMRNRSIDIKLAGVKYSKTSTSDLKELHKTKLDFIKDKREEGTLQQQDYGTMLTDSEYGFDILNKMANINRSAFGDDFSGLGMNVVIDSAKIINTLESKIRLR